MRALAPLPASGCLKAAGRNAHTTSLGRPQLLSLSLLHTVGHLPRSQGTPDLRQVVAPETSTLYLMGLAQFIILGLVFNKGHPHRCGDLLSVTLQGPHA